MSDSMRVRPTTLSSGGCGAGLLGTRISRVRSPPCSRRSFSFSKSGGRPPGFVIQTVKSTTHLLPLRLDRKGWPGSKAFRFMSSFSICFLVVSLVMRSFSILGATAVSESRRCARTAVSENRRCRVGAAPAAASLCVVLLATRLTLRGNWICSRKTAVLAPRTGCGLSCPEPPSPLVGTCFEDQLTPMRSPVRAPAIPSIRSMKI
mmetsp:Transcript_46727/g.83675  ORF Transcript_46727/g.83675 Transcript_46727/m.83675 type:complete len:205 (+) Transcript_46727:1812-2426(+)